MSNLKGLSQAVAVVNSPHTGEWHRKIGSYMLNFGTIEFFTYQHLDMLEPSRADFDKNLVLLPSRRIERLTTLIQSSTLLQPQLQTRLTTLWQEVTDLAVWRNRIAHNAVLLVWKSGSDPNNSPPDLLGVADMRQLKFGKTSDAISLNGLDALIDASSELGTKLNEASTEIRTCLSAASQS